MKQSYTKISVAKKPLTAADTNAIDTALAKKPDVVVITGHNKDVEPAVIQIGKHKHMPKAILAVNGISQLDNYGTDSLYANCVMMPTQWDSSASTKDAVVGWTSADFISAMGGAATYQQAAAASVGVGLSNAMEINSDKTKLVATLSSMDVDCFYGKLKWDAKGRMQKPMYTQQKQGEDKKIVAPTSANSHPVAYPLGSASCWGELEKFGFRKDDKVSWKRNDPNALKKGSIGVVVGFTDEYVRVKFSDTKIFLMDPKELKKEPADSVISGTSLMAGCLVACMLLPFSLVGGVL